MKKIEFVFGMAVLSSLYVTACNSESTKNKMERINLSTENSIGRQVNPEERIEMTTPVPQDYFKVATQQGTVEVLYYHSRDYTRSDQPDTDKPAYIYLPHEYDKNQSYDIIYLLHGWTGTAEQYFGISSWPQMKNLFDNMIQRGDVKPFIAVSPTWDKDNKSKGWGESVEEIAAFWQEYERDLIPAVEGKYATYAETTDHDGIVASRDHRAFGGFSLGSVTTWYIFEHCFDLQRWYLPMSGDSWHIEMFGGATQPQKTAAFLASVVNASAYKTDFHVWHAVGTSDVRFDQTHNQAIAMMELPEFPSSVFSYHQRKNGQHDFNSVWEFCYHALPTFFPKNR